MGAGTFCDGCGKRGEERMTRIGMLDAKDYCDACAAVVDTYMRDRDKLHEKVIAEWSRGAAELREAVASGHPSMTLPDDF